MPKPLGEQLQIDVAPAPGAIGRWDADHEIAAYRRSMGDDAFSRQRRLAEEAKECTCGKQAEADKHATENGDRTRKLFGWEHKAGCNSFTRRNPRLAVRITDDERQARYAEARRADDLRDALAQMREREGES